MSSSLNFDVNGNHYEISLTPTEQDSLNSVIIGGIKYTVGGEREVISLFAQKTRGLNLISMEIGDLQNRLSILDNAQSIPKISKIHSAALDVLFSKKALSQAVRNRSKVLNELEPTWPIPGSSPVVSIVDRMKELGVPGVRISIINNGKEDWSQGIGELEKSNTMIQAASISKVITALTVLALIQDGLKTPKQEPLSLDTRIEDILDFDLWNSICNGQNHPITLRQLMSHTAGLERDTPSGYRGYERISALEIEKTNSQIFELEDELQYLKKEDTFIFQKEELINKILQRIEELKIANERASKGELPDLDEIIKGKGTNSPPIQVTAKPGSQFAYSGGGAMILQKVIEIIAQTNEMPTQTYEGIVKEKIFDKLGMKDSGFFPAENRTIHGNGDDGKPLPGKWVQQPELAAAGLWSTPKDLAKIVIGIQKSLLNQGEGIIEYDLAQEMIKEPSHLELPEGIFPGLGIFVDKTSKATYFYHSGSNLGFRCLMVGNDRGQGAVVMTNSEFGDEIIPEIIRKVADTYNWKGTGYLSMLPPLHPEVVETSQNSLPVDIKKWAKNYQGKYENDRRKGAIVSVELNEELGKIYFRTPNPNQAPIEIIPISEHVGIIKENGRWFPIEFAKSADQLVILNIHGMNHTKFTQS